MRTIGTEANIGRLLNEQGAEWAWIARVQILNVSTGNTDTIRVARFMETVVYDSVNYLPFPFQIGEMIEDVGGQQATVQVTFVDLTGEVSEFLRDNPLGSAKVRLSLVYDKNTISTAGTGSRDWDSVIAEDYNVQGYMASFEGITLSLGAVNFLDIRFPHRTVSRDRCSFQYKGTGCKYAGGLPTCDFSLQGSNGCEQHNNEANFGAFPSIPLIV